MGSRECTQTGLRPPQYGRRCSDSVNPAPAADPSTGQKRPFYRWESRSAPARLFGRGVPRRIGSMEVSSVSVHRALSPAYSHAGEA